MTILDLNYFVSASELADSVKLDAVAVPKVNFGWSPQRAAGRDSFESHAVDLAKP